jgi:hypothetical protein
VYAENSLARVREEGVEDGEEDDETTTVALVDTAKLVRSWEPIQRELYLRKFKMEWSSFLDKTHVTSVSLAQPV